MLASTISYSIYNHQEVVFCSFLFTVSVSVHVGQRRVVLQASLHRGLLLLAFAELPFFKLPSFFLAYCVVLLVSGLPLAGDLVLLAVSGLVLVKLVDCDVALFFRDGFDSLDFSVAHSDHPVAEVFQVDLMGYHD